MSDDPTKSDLDDLENRLKRARKEGATGNTASGGANRGDASGYSMAMRVGAELVSALIVGVGVGLALDHWLDTGPWFLIVFFFLGAAAGVLNVYRAANNMGLAPGYRQDADTTFGVKPPNDTLDKL